MRLSRPLSLLLCLTVVSAIGCTRVRSRAAFQDGNKLYKEEDFKKAIVEYEHAVELDPSFAEAHFYLGSSHQALYRPGKDSPENQQRLEKAIHHYRASLEANPRSTDAQKNLRLNTLGFLIGIYSDDPYRDFDTAHNFAQELLKERNDIKSQFALAGLYEKFDKVSEAEATYQKISADNPKDPKACAALAAFYNKPLWDGRSRFEEAVGILGQCADLTPDDPTGYYKVATFYWDRAFRDHELQNPQKDAYADKGLQAVEKALTLKPDHVDALVYKGLLFRVKALVAPNPRTAQQYLDQAETLKNQAVALRKEQQQAQQASAAPAEGAGEPAAN